MPYARQQCPAAPSSRWRLQISAACTAMLVVAALLFCGMHSRANAAWDAPLHGVSAWQLDDAPVGGDTPSQQDAPAKKRRVSAGVASVSRPLSPSGQSPWPWLSAWAEPARHVAPTHTPIITALSAPGLRLQRGQAPPVG